MGYSVVRGAVIDPRIAAQPLPPARLDAFDDTYVLLRDETPQWQVAVDWGEHGSVPFREEIVWTSAGVLAIGGGGAAHLLDLATATARSRIEMGFGGLGLDQHHRTLYVLGWTDIVAVDHRLRVRWQARHIAVDGIVFRDATDEVLRVSAEMDPPGGWFDVTLDASTGREVGRRPNFTDGDVGVFRPTV